MSTDIEDREPSEAFDSAPGDDIDTGASIRAGVVTYLLGLILAAGLTFASFWAVDTNLIYGPGIPAAISVLALAQMGIHLVFFLHITTAPDNTNNILALAFGVLIAFLVVLGSLWIMLHLNHNMLPMNDYMHRQR